MVLLHATKITPTMGILDWLSRSGTAPLSHPVYAHELLKRPEVKIDDLAVFCPALKRFNGEALEQAQIRVKYAGYLKRQEEQIAGFEEMESIAIPQDIDYTVIPGLSREIQEKLIKVSPTSLGQVSRISGVTPAAVSILMMVIKRGIRKPVTAAPRSA